MMGQPGVQRPRYRPGESMEGQGSGQGPCAWGATAVMYASLLCCELKRSVKSAWSNVLGWKDNLGMQRCCGFTHESVSCIHSSR